MVSFMPTNYKTFLMLNLSLILLYADGNWMNTNKNNIVHRSWCFQKWCRRHDVMYLKNTTPIDNFILLHDKVSEINFCQHLMYYVCGQK